MTQLVSVQRQIRSTDRAQPAEPQFSEPARYNQDTYLSDIRIQMDARFSAYGAIEVKIDRISVFKQTQQGAFRQNKNISIPTGNTILPIRRMVEIWIWNPHTADPVSVGISYSYGIEPLLQSDLGESRSLEEFNQELSTNVGGLDQETRDLLAELGKLRANIGARRITIDVDDLKAKITATVAAIESGESAAGIRRRIGEIYDILGEQEIANTIPEITAQLSGILTAINNNDIEIETEQLEDLIDDLKDKTVPDDLGISDGIKSADGAPIPDAAQDPMKAMRAALVDLLNGFDLNELKAAITVFEKQIPLFEAAAPDDDLITQFKLILLRLKRQQETIPDPRTSESSLLFPEATYREDEIHTNILDTKGHTHFIATMKSTPVSDPAMVLKQTEATWGGSTTYTRTIYYDSKNSNIVKSLRICLGLRPRQVGNGTYNHVGYTLFYDWDNDLAALTARAPTEGRQAAQGAANPAENWFRVAGLQPTVEHMIPASLVSRYWKFTIIIGTHAQLDGVDLRDTIQPDPADPMQDIIYPKGISDDKLTAGEATLAFEFRDNLGNWYPAIPPAGPLKTGGAPVIIRFSEAAYGFPLPTGAAVLRARLDIAKGNIDLGVAMLLLS